MSVFAGQLQHNLLLGIIGVLVFVYQDIAETVNILLTDFFMVLKQQEGLYQKIVEIHGISLSAALRVPIIYSTYLRPFFLCIIGSPRTNHILLRK